MKSNSSARRHLFEHHHMQRIGRNRSVKPGARDFGASGLPTCAVAARKQGHIGRAGSNSSVSHETTRSVPPYNFGRVSQGATCDPHREYSFQSVKAGPAL